MTQPIDEPYFRIPEDEYVRDEPKPKRRLLRTLVLSGTLGACLLLTLWYAASPPRTFPIDTPITIPEGSGVRDIALSLKTGGFMRSEIAFLIYARFSGRDTELKAGEYRFESPQTLHGLVDALVLGGIDSNLLSLTFPEGFTITDIRTYTGDRFVAIDTERYRSYEGYLFPETYFVAPRETFDDLVARMRALFDERIEPYLVRIAERGYTVEEVVILASIIEREANDPESMRMVAGILENRLAADMPLQVDATFEYILGKTSAELTLDDLAMDSPYNTYTNRGLPPTPIANPGLDAILAVLEPIPSDYYYYLTGNDGKFYYAKTHDEHVRNKVRYLR